MLCTMPGEVYKPEVAESAAGFFCLLTIDCIANIKGFLLSVNERLADVGSIFSVSVAVITYIIIYHKNGNQSHVRIHHG